MKIPLKIFFLRYTNIFNTTVGVDFFTTDSEIEMFCYLFLSWPRNMISVLLVFGLNLFGFSQRHIKESLWLVFQLIFLSELFVNSKLVSFPRYTNIFNITVGDDFLTTNSKIEMFYYLLPPWPKNVISVLLEFGIILFALSYWHIKESLWFICQLIFLRELLVNRKLVSSA